MDVAIFMLSYILYEARVELEGWLNGVLPIGVFDAFPY